MYVRFAQYGRWGTSEGEEASEDALRQPCVTGFMAISIVRHRVRAICKGKLMLDSESVGFIFKLAKSLGVGRAAEAAKLARLPELWDSAWQAWHANNNVEPGSRHDYDGQRPADISETIRDDLRGQGR